MKHLSLRLASLGSATCALFLLLAPVAAQQASRPWTLERSEVHTLTSDRGDSYELAIALPYTYHATSARYPVLIVLDGASLFPMVTQVSAQLYYTGYARELTPGDPRLMKFELLTTSEMLEKQLLSRKYPSLHVSRNVFDGEAHMTVIPFTFSRGIRALYGK